MLHRHVHTRLLSMYIVTDVNNLIALNHLMHVHHTGVFNRVTMWLITLTVLWSKGWKNVLMINHIVTWLPLHVTSTVYGDMATPPCHLDCIWWHSDIVTPPCHLDCIWWHSDMVTPPCHLDCIWWHSNMVTPTCYLDSIWWHSNMAVTLCHLDCTYGDMVTWLPLYVPSTVHMVTWWHGYPYMSRRLYIW